MLEMSKAISRKRCNIRTGIINDLFEIIPIESNGTTKKGSWTPIWRTVYTSEVNGARKVKSDAYLAMNKNLVS